MTDSSDATMPLKRTRIDSEARSHGRWGVGDHLVLTEPLFCKECVCRLTIPAGTELMIRKQHSPKRVIVCLYTKDSQPLHKVRTSRIRGKLLRSEGDT